MYAGTRTPVLRIRGGTNSTTASTSFFEPFEEEDDGATDEAARRVNVGVGIDDFADDGDDDDDGDNESPLVLRVAISLAR